VVRGNARRSTCVLKEPCSQRRRIYEVGVLKNVRPATKRVLEINFVFYSKHQLKRSTWWRCPVMQKCWLHLRQAPIL